jgi:hypothetical protein
MDQDLLRFRQAGARENAGRPAIRRRYSPELQHQPVACCQARCQHGDSLGHVAATLGRVRRLGPSGYAASRS